MRGPSSVLGRLSSVLCPPSSAPVKLPDSKDFWSGVMLIAIGAAAVVIGRDYPFGTALRMGAGFFPLVLGAVLVLFGVLMQHAGFVPALFVLVVGSAAAGTEFKLVEVLLLAGLLTVLCVALFIWALGLPYPLFAGS